MATHTPVQDDPKQLADAQNFWAFFMQVTKWSIVAIAALLIVLALVFVPTGA